MWTKETIKTLLLSNDRAVERAVLALYERQTIAEQHTDSTQHKNGMGFSAFHAKMGSYYAKWIKNGNHLSGVHLGKARSLSLKYCGQLSDIAAEKVYGV